MIAGIPERSAWPGDDHCRLRRDIRPVHGPVRQAETQIDCCQPAGGQAAPWSLIVPFYAAPGQVITIVVHTGGHVATVERFAVTGVRVG